MKGKKKKFTVRDLCVIGLLAALSYVCFTYIQFKISLPGGDATSVHLGNMVPVPFIMLLLTAVQMIPSISNAQFMELIVGLVPVDYKSLAFRVVNDLSLKSPATMISVTAITALWSAGRGMFSVARGLKPTVSPTIFGWISCRTVWLTA